MVKITKGNRITIPPEIMKLKEWKIGDEIIVIPDGQQTNGKLNKETPITIRSISKKGGDSEK